MKSLFNVSITVYFANLPSPPACACVTANFSAGAAAAALRLYFSTLSNLCRGLTPPFPSLLVVTPSPADVANDDKAAHAPSPHFLLSTINGCITRLRCADKRVSIDNGGLIIWCPYSYILSLMVKLKTCR